MKRLKKWFKNVHSFLLIKVKHRKTLKKLENDPELMKQTMDRFVKEFGLNAKVRTKKQWQKLVSVYGIETVCQKENMSEKEVELHCAESFKKQLERKKRQLRTV